NVLLDPAARRCQNEYRQHQHSHTAQLDAQRLSATAFPFPGHKSQNAFGDDDQRHEQWPPQNRSPTTELASCDAIECRTREPEKRHDSGKQPVRRCAGEAVTMSRLILTKKINTVQEIG